MLRRCEVVGICRKVFALTAMLTLMSFLASGYATPIAADSDLVYCPLTKTYQPRTTAIERSSALDEICVTDRSKERFVADLLRSQKLTDIADASALAKAFFQYARDGKAAIDRIERPRNSRENTPDQLRSNSDDAIVTRIEKQPAALISFMIADVAAPQISTRCNAKPTYSQRPIVFSDGTYANLRPRSPPIFS